MFRMVGRHVRQQFAGYIALFIALGGVCYAAMTLPKNSVTGQGFSHPRRNPSAWNPAR